MDQKHLNFVIVKIIDLPKGKQGVAYLCWTMKHFMNIRHQLKMISHGGKLVYRFNTKLLWVRMVEEYDYAAISFVLDEFTDDHLYCFTILDQYFEHRAKDIGLEDLCKQLN